MFVDMVNIAHNGGAEAVRELMKAFEGLPLRAYFSAPSYCPMDPELETAAAEIRAADIAQMLGWKDVVSIGETVSSKILDQDSDFLARLAACDTLDKIVSGHGGDLPRGDLAALDAYVAVGVRDDHCVACNEDIDARLRRGVSMFLVEAPGREQVQGFFDYIRDHQIPTEKMSLCIDNITIMDIVGTYGGYLDKPLRMGLRAGLPPAEVVRMATLNPAAHYHKDSLLGSLTPGRLADIVLLRELDRFPPEIVIVGGKVLDEVSLRIGGIMSAEPYERLLEDVEKANAAARSLGCPLPHPFFTMAQTVLLSLPEVGLTDRGMVDVAAGRLVNVLED